MAGRRRPATRMRRSQAWTPSGASPSSRRPSCGWLDPRPERNTMTDSTPTDDARNGGAQQDDSAAADDTAAETGSESPEEGGAAADARSEEHTSELQSLMRNSYAVFCLKKK